jgi:hypothetical protein
LVALAIGAVSLLAPEPALADQALFRVQRTFLGAPFPGIQTPGCVLSGPNADCAGRSTVALEPDKPFTSSIIPTAHTFQGTVMGILQGPYRVCSGDDTIQCTNDARCTDKLCGGDLATVCSVDADCAVNLCSGDHVTICNNNADCAVVGGKCEPAGGTCTDAVGGTCTLVPTANPGVAQVQAGNPIGGAFTLQKDFIQYQGTATAFPSTAFTGYLSRSILDYGNGLARFRPDNPHGAKAETTVTIHKRYPATVGGAYTTTHAGLFDFARNGYLHIRPDTGGNNFGGTMRILYDPASEFYQYISYFNPLFFKAYGVFKCTRMGVDCNDTTETYLGEVTSSGSAFRKLLDPTVFTYATPTTMGKTKYRKIADPGATSKAYYLHLQAPWTTGYVSVGNTVGKTSGYGAQPRSDGYDIDLGGVNLKLTRTYTSVYYKNPGNTSYTTHKYYSRLTGVTRVVSLVKPRITHTYLIPRIATDPIINNYQANRVQIMKVFFLPEPTGALMLGAGVALLLGLSRIRWR